MGNIKPLIISRTLPYLGGREVVVDMLIKSFAQKGPVSVLTPDNYRRTTRVNVHKITRNRKAILKWARKQNVTLINCHTFYLSELAFYLSRELKIPLIFTLHGVFINFYGKKYGEILKRIYSRSHLVITVSNSYKKTLSNYLDDSSKLTTIKNGVDLDLIDKIRAKSSDYYRKKNLLPKDKFIVLTPARLTYLKGLNYLLEAINKIDDKEILFIIASPKGRKNQEETLYKKKLINFARGKHAGLKFLSLDQNKILEYYQSSDLIVLPSLVEGISISVLEAMAFEKTVIATRVGGNPEIIDNKKNGYLIRSKNAESIKKTILLIKNNFTALDTGKIGRRMVEKSFLRDRMIKNYYKAFKKVTDENK